MSLYSTFTVLFVIALTLIMHININYSREYIYIEEYLNWFEAMDYCMHHFDTTLATIINDNEINIATNIMNNEIAWIGLEDINNNNQWVWSDSTECALTNSLCTNYWSQSLMHGLCVYHSMNEFEYGFHANNCYDLQPFLCNAPINHNIGCNYLNIEGHGFPTNKCLLYKYNNHKMSYKYKCNYNTNAINLNYYFNSENCNNNPSLILNVSNITSFNCNYFNNSIKQCNNNNIMNIKWYIYEFNNTQLTQTTEECIQNEEYNYMEQRIINQCLQMNETHFIIWECFNKYYIGKIYSDKNCIYLIETYTFEYGQCIDGLIQYHSCYNQPILTQTIDTCDYANINGILRRINVCHSTKFNGNDFFYKFECMENNIKNNVSEIVKKWYNINGCNGNAFHIDYYNINDIFDYKCSNNNGNICNENDVLIVRNYDKNNCQENANYYTESDVIINKCFRENININKNGSKLIECNGNDFGYVIKYFNDNNCQNMNNISIEIYNENECINNELEYIIWCNGRTNIKYISHEKCEYFMNNNNLIHAINQCTMYKLAGGYFSNQYICDYKNNILNEIWYKGIECNNKQIIAIYNYSKLYNNFNCNKFVNITNNNQCNNENKLLKLKWYKKDPLTSNGNCIKKNGFIDDNIIITNECIPYLINNQDIIYIKIECDYDLDWFKINYYQNFNCNHYSKVDSIRYENNECYNGDVLSIVSCNGNGKSLSSSSSSWSSYSSSSSSSSDS